MWAQLITMRVKAGQEDSFPAMIAELDAAEQAGSGLIRSVAMQDQKDPTHAYVLVVFESEEQARAREQDPVRQEALASMRARMADVLDGPPGFVDLTVVRDTGA